ncbi:hypothetical protein LTS14_000728 [Recurvomyces mirabilis]|nr:hypothetical protein LTS14_000728 [Recurvomyces mirabilis]
MTEDHSNNVATSHKGRRRGPKTKSAHGRTSSSKTNGEHDETHLQLARAKMASTTRNRPLLYSAIPDADMLDAQMFSFFFDFFVPATIPVWRKVSYLHTLAGTSPSTALLKRAKRTVGLAHLAFATHNQSILHESQVSYTRLLGLLQFSLHFQPQSPGVKPQDMHELMATIALLTHLHDPLVSDSPTSDDSWVGHILGIHQIFATYGGNLTSLSAPGAVHQGLARHTMLNGLWVGIVKRRAWNIDPAWLETGSLGWTRVVSVFYELPALLGRTDKALLADQTDELMKIVRSLQLTIQQGKDLFRDVRFKSASLDALTPWLQGPAEEHCALQESRVFPRLYLPFVGEKEIEVQKLLMRTLLCLIAECTVLRIWHFHPVTTHSMVAGARYATEQRARDLARQLCMASLSFTQGDRIVQPFTLGLCLQLARNVFEQQQAYPEMGWCDACLIANDLRVARLRKTGAPSLCKIAQVIPGLAEAGQYGSKLNVQNLIIRAEEHGTMKMKGLLPP